MRRGGGRRPSPAYTTGVRQPPPLAAAGAPPQTRIELLGVPVDVLGGERAAELCRERLENESSPPLQVVTLNPEMVMAANRTPELAAAIRGAGLVLADGWGIVWAARRMGRPLPERIPGVDFLVELCRDCARLDRSVFLLGSAPGVGELAFQRLLQLAPGLRLAGCLSPGREEAERAAPLVRSSGAGLLAVALGVPAQDLWLHRHLEESGCRVGIGVGGSLDYLSGRVGRAPAPLRRAGLEWAYRLLRQPWRLPRMARGSRFFWRVWREARG